VEYLLKWWLLAVKSHIQSLDYCANSYHIHLNNLKFHGYGKEISQKIPLLIPTYKYFLPQYSSSTLSFLILKFISPTAALTKSSRSLAVKNLSYGKVLLEPSNLRFFLLFRRKWSSTSLFLRFNPFPSSLSFTAIFTFLQFYLLSIFSPFFLFFWSPNSRI